MPSRKPSLKKIATQLKGKLTPSDIARRLKISPQKWGAVQKKIKRGDSIDPKIQKALIKQSGKLSKPRKSKKDIEFEKFLKDSGLTKREFKKQQTKLKRELKKEKGVPTLGRSGEVFFESHNALKKNIPHARTIKTIPNRKDAVNWWKGIGGGRDYFVITQSISKKTGKPLFNVVDIRTQKELSPSKKGSVGEARARQLILDIMEGNDEDD